VRSDIRQIIGERNRQLSGEASLRGQEDGGSLRIFYINGQNLRLNGIISPLIVHYSRKNDFGKEMYKSSTLATIPYLRKTYHFKFTRKMGLLRINLTGRKQKFAFSLKAVFVCRQKISNNRRIRINLLWHSLNNYGEDGSGYSFSKPL
jgi:hypothetical protein